jgi:hypothetical protein
VVIDNSISISIFIIVVVTQINRAWRKATDSLSLAAISGERRHRAMDSPASMVTAASSDVMAMSGLCLAVTRGGRSSYSDVW